MREGKDNVEVRHIKQALLLRLDPLKPSLLCAQVAASMAAGMTMLPSTMTFRAGIKTHTQITRAALRNR